MDMDDDWSAGIFAAQPQSTSLSHSPSSQASAHADDEITATIKEDHKPVVNTIPSKQAVAQSKARADAVYTHTPLAPVPSLSFNVHLDSRVDPGVPKGKAFFSFAVDPAQWNYRYMFTPKKAVTSGTWFIYTGASSYADKMCWLLCSAGRQD